jgi:simple sugar transport system permease protein
MTFQLSNLIVSIMATSTPLLLAASGELVVEKSGVLNLGLEGMMLVGAVVGFAVTYHSGSATLGALSGALAGALMATVFAVLTVSLLANQVATGLALTIFGTGLSALAGASYVGIAVEPIPTLDLPLLSDLPFVGPVLFQQNAFIYLSFVALGAIAWFLYRTHAGLILRAVGDSHDAAHAIGYNVVGIRYLASAFGGAMSGLAGADLSIGYSTSWAENMTAGRGWIALALVVFSTWRPFWLLVGAYLFGGIMYLSLFIQGTGLAIPSQLVASLPYLATIAVLVAISRDRARIRLNAPACLGLSFRAAG